MVDERFGKMWEKRLFVMLFVCVNIYEKKKKKKEILAKVLRIW